MDTELFDQESFYRAFMKDLTHAKQRVIIESPFITTRRLQQLLPVLTRLVPRSIPVIVNTGAIRRT
jgi:hypothetical protein